MFTGITRGELADLAEQMPKGALRTWCDQCSAGPRAQVVYCNSEMLSRCRDSVSSPKSGESKKESKKCKVSKTLRDKPGTSL